MIYEIQSKNDLSDGACLVIRFPEKDLDRKALYTIDADQPDFIVPFRHRSIDGQIECTYMLGDRSKLMYRFGHKSVAEYTNFWTGLLQPILDCGDWFLKPSSFVLETGNIYIGRDDKTISYIYVPTLGDCVGLDSIRTMAQEIAEMNPVDDLDIENRVLRAIMQGFRPGEFLKMLRSAAGGASIKEPGRNTPPPMPPAPAAAPEMPPARPPERPPARPEKSALERSKPSEMDNRGDLIIDFEPKKPIKSKEKVKKPEKKAERSKKEPKHGLFGGKKERDGIVVGAASPQAESKNEPIEKPEIIPVSDGGFKPEQSGETMLGDIVGLRLISGSSLPKFIDVNIEPGGVFTIGRFNVAVGVKQSSFEFDGNTMAVSRHHAAIERAETGEYTIVDLNSKAGTFVEGARLTPNIPHKLTRGCRVSFGTVGADYIWEE